MRQYEIRNEPVAITEQSQAPKIEIEEEDDDNEEIKEISLPIKITNPMAILGDSLVQK